MIQIDIYKLRDKPLDPKIKYGQVVFECWRAVATLKVLREVNVPMKGQRKNDVSL